MLFFFLIVIKHCFYFLFCLKCPCFSHVLPMVFQLVFDRTTSFSFQVLSSSVKNLSSIYFHTEGDQLISLCCKTNWLLADYFGLAMFLHSICKEEFPYWLFYIVNQTPISTPRLTLLSYRRYIS